MENADLTHSDQGKEALEVKTRVGLLKKRRNANLQTEDKTVFLSD